MPDVGSAEEKCGKIKGKALTSSSRAHSQFIWLSLEWIHQSYEKASFFSPWQDLTAENFPSTPCIFYLDVWIHTTLLQVYIFIYILWFDANHKM